MCFREITNTGQFAAVGAQVGLEPGSHLAGIRADGAELLQAAFQGFTANCQKSQSWRIYLEVLLCLSRGGEGGCAFEVPLRGLGLNLTLTFHRADIKGDASLFWVGFFLLSIHVAGLSEKYS